MATNQKQDAAATGTVMVFSKLPAYRLSKLRQRLVVVIGMCAVFLAVPSPADPGYEAADSSSKQIRIKRLKLADPESTETMLAGRSHSLPLRTA